MDEVDFFDSPLFKKEMKKLILQIAQYGERAYRRGAHHAVCFGLDIETANRLRYKDDGFSYEIVPLEDKKFELRKCDLIDRLDSEMKGELLDRLICGFNRE